MKKVSNIFYSIFFVAAAIFLGYCFAEFREDVGTMICATIVMLIATFLLIDVLVSVYKAEKNDYLQKAQERQDASTAELKKTLEEILKFEKAIYVINKREHEEKQKEQAKEEASDAAKFRVS